MPLASSWRIRSRESELAADLLEAPLLAAALAEAEPQLEHPALALVERAERLAQPLVLERGVRQLDRVVGVGVGEEVAELTVAVADRLVERDRSLDRVKSLLGVLQLQLGRLGQLLGRRRTAFSRLEPLSRPAELLAPLLDVHRHADRRGLVRDRPLAGLADPPGRVRRELEALAPVELLDRAVQADDAVLDQVQSGTPCPW